MEPRQQAPAPAFERAPTQPASGEGYQLPEVLPDGSQERRPEINPGRPSQAELPAQPPAIPVIPAPLTPIPDDTPVAAVPADDNPVSAADEDLIEKEWVDKAKKIIEQTKDDPYKREQEIGKLQRDYIKKRYGREIGEPSS